jgi:hypothetical protein
MHGGVALQPINFHSRVTSIAAGAARGARYAPCRNNKNVTGAH